LILPVIAGLTGAAVSIAAVLFRASGDMASRPKVYLYLFLCVGISFFVLTIILEEYSALVRHVRISRNRSWWRSLPAPFRLNPRRYGGYLVHAGMVFVFLGVAFSSAFQTQYQEKMSEGDSVRFGPYTVRLASLGHDDLDTDLSTANQLRIWADLEVFRGETPVSLLRPMRVYYASNPEQPMYEVAIHSTLMTDFYTLLSGFDIGKGTAVVGAFVNPMVAWLWLGGLFVLIGGLVALVPMRRM